MRERETGFSTVELVVTLVILAAVTIAVIPTLANVFGPGGALALNRTKGAAEQVASAIEQTRAYAILQSCTYLVTFSGNNQVQINPDPGTCSIDATGEGPTRLVNNGQVAPQGDTDGSCGGEWCIWFKSTGTSIAKSIIVNPGSNQRTVAVTVAGRVRVTVP